MMSAEQDHMASYHVELRQFPHNFCHFNLSKPELYDTIVGPWAREQWIELGERKWNPHQAKLTVLQGPHLPIDQLSMGRGWRNAQRTGRDVTERVLAAAKADMQSSQASPAAASQARDEDLLADSLGLELLAQLAAGAVSLRRAWEIAAARHPDRSAGQSLALAERAITSLLASSLIVLVRNEGEGETQRPLEETDPQTALHSTDSWTEEIVGIARR
jgi:hypothetical protein